ncbi:uncharacterized protein LOC131242975 isoform X2 [Magnolia sinica]|uniref:uncharacterized protein LOC131242975 isoform X2 n=1 Tax=Magnolia sinica TaxID=86752 RepID=UPI00265B1C84|nr:uncharacterized protein LOC131242975 isoform X2 [Magnolia sinica]
MDSIFAAALEEICLEGRNGIALPNLWMRLQNHPSLAGLDPCSAVKESIWNRLLNIAGMQFEVRGSTFAPDEPSIRTVQGSEKLGLKIIAPERLRDSFLGLDDLKAADGKTSEDQRRLLERIAITRTNGITQSQLAKEFGMKGNDLFYPVRNLECRRLIVRQSTIVRRKEPAIEGEKSENSTNCSPIATNLIHLCRYAKHLNLSSQQRLEITKPDTVESFGNVDGNTLTGVGVSGESSKEDVLVKDYVPELKAVCDKLEEAGGKVLVVSDIKQALGYRKTPGHRAWRNICNRLKDARLVEEFRAEVNKKVVNCLRLLKKFDPKSFQPKTAVFAYDDFDTDQPDKCGNKGQTSDLLVELPIEHQVYDMVDAEGSKGITVMEVSKRLGLKRSKNRLQNMFSRFGMPLQSENHNKSSLYRVWTPRNFSHKECHSYDESKQLVIGGTGPGLGNEITGTSYDVKTDTVNEVPESGAPPLEASVPISSIPSKLRSSQRYPCLPTAVGVQREQRILERLQNEKFILTAELHRWLEGLEKDKPTAMARKTLTRLLNRLQQEGHCKCALVTVPAVTNCGRSRTAEVVLHPSFVDFTPALLTQIQEKLRLFDMQSRGQGLARSKNDQSVPVLTGIKRTSTCIASDAQVKAETMRANGFVPAKMVRAKLLHNFLWGYLCSLPDWHDALSSGKHGYDLKNPHSTCKLFALDVALKAMPLELFLQVVGSTQNFEDLLESCRHGLRLSDLPVEEYKSLMANHANERLSRVIDILMRLKLIRLVTEECVGAIDKGPCAILMHAMELKPYIEEPLFRALRSSSVHSSDLRPRIRHDFILSNKEAVDAYWKTLEYCYATADPVAASHAFPGSAIPEVFLCRSWASARVMAADQRAELLKRVANDVPDKKIPFKDCVKIAAELNLSLEQVLRVSYDKRRSRHPVFLGEQDTKNHVSIAKKRKISSENKSLKHVKSDTVTGELTRSPLLSDSDLKNTEQENCCPTSMEDHEIGVQTCDEVNHPNAVEELETNEEDGESSSFISQFAFSRLRPTRRKKFSWTENSDRQLVIQYARHRAALGARYHRADWASISDLPAPPDTCRRRMAMLNNDPNIRRAVMKLCNLLGERYVKHLDKISEKELMKHGSSGQTFQNSPLVGILTDSQAHENTLGSHFKEYFWDDFEEENIKMAVDEVIYYKRMGKPETCRSRREKEWPDLPQVDETNPSIIHDSHQISGLISSSNPGKGIHNYVEREVKDHRMVFFASRSRSSSQRLGKFQKLWNDGGISKKVCGSLSIANAVELLKVVFLSTSAVPEVPKLLEGTLRRYSKHDIFAAFNYLRERKFMVIGQGSQPFVFSQKFWHDATSSPFPDNTGKRAANFANWLHKREEELLQDEANLSADLQCGDIFHLFALVSSGELSISPVLPAEGVGEADEQSSLKRKIDKRKSYCDEKFKKQKVHDSNNSDSRREKGFPGIKVSLSRATYSRAEAVDFFANDEKHTSSWSYDETNLSKSFSHLIPGGTASPIKNLNPDHIFDSGDSVKMAPNERLWEAITSYVELSTSRPAGWEQLAPFSLQLFMTVHVAIHKAGEQGLNMEEVSRVMVMQGEKMAEFIVDMLQIFGLVIKVNAYDCVRALDASYGPKYLLSSITGHYQDAKPASCFKSQVMNNERFQTLLQESHEDSNTLQQTTMNLCDGHKVTILDFPEEGDQPDGKAQTNAGDDKLENYMEEACSSEGVERESRTSSDDLPTFRPILPWLNGDGSTNTVLYRGLTRNILGAVMQNPGISESCRKLLELLVLDNHLTVREMHQTTSSNPPAILGSLVRSQLGSRPASVFRKHFFANPMSTSLL